MNRPIRPVPVVPNPEEDDYSAGKGMLGFVTDLHGDAPHDCPVTARKPRPQWHDSFGWTPGPVNAREHSPSSQAIVASSHVPLRFSGAVRVHTGPSLQPAAWPMSCTDAESRGRSGKPRISSRSSPNRVGEVEGTSGSLRILHNLARTRMRRMAPRSHQVPMPSSTILGSETTPLHAFTCAVGSESEANPSESIREIRVWCHGIMLRHRSPA